MGRYCYPLAISMIGLFLLTLEAFADDWMLRKEGSSAACHVQEKTAAKMGEDFKGPFATRKAACNEAAAQYDSSLSDKSKCLTYGGGTVDGCKKDGVKLPP